MPAPSFDYLTDPALAGRELLEQIRLMTPSRNELNYTVIVSFREFAGRKEVVPMIRDVRQKLHALVNSRDGGMPDDIYSFDDDFASERRELQIHEASKFDFVLLITTNEYRIISITNEIKLLLLRMLERYLPSSFGQVNQAKLVQTYDLSRHRKVALRRVERLLETDAAPTQSRQPDGDAGTVALPAPDIANATHLLPEHIGMVEETFRRIGPGNFADVFIRHQQLSLVTPNAAPQPMITEIYCSTQAIKRHILNEIDLTRHRKLFHHLTTRLDRLMLTVINQNPERLSISSSINLNIESVFSREFETFEKSVLERLSSTSIELLISDILGNFDEFGVARDMLFRRRASIAIDGLVPEMLGMVDIGALGAGLAKIHWRPGAEAVLTAKRAEIARLQAKGIVFALTRVEDDEAFRVGQSLGIKLFQGFRVDELLKAARNTDNPVFWHGLDGVIARIEDMLNVVKVNGKIQGAEEVREADAKILDLKKQLEAIEPQSNTVEELRAVIRLRNKIQEMETLVFDTV